PIVRMGEYTLEAVQEAHARAIELFDRDGKAGILRRHRYALENHMFPSRIARLLSDLRAAAGTPQQRAMPGAWQPELPRRQVIAERPLPAPSVSAAACEFSDIEAIDFEVSTLLHNAATLNQKADLVEGIRNGQNILLFSCEFGPCCEALSKTLQVLRNHYPSISEDVVIGDKLLEHMENQPGDLLLASHSLLTKLASHSHASDFKSIGELVGRLESGARDA